MAAGCASCPSDRQSWYAYNEGYTHVGGNRWKPFGVSWRALIPNRQKCTNLISPTCPSSSYIAYGSIRILPTFMMLGQSAGCAAALAVEKKIPVQEVDYSDLEKGLIDCGMILKLPENWLEIVSSNN